MLLYDSFRLRPFFLIFVSVVDIRIRLIIFDTVG